MMLRCDRCGCPLPKHAPYYGVVGVPMMQASDILAKGLVYRRDICADCAVRVFDLEMPSVKDYVDYPTPELLTEGYSKGGEGND